MTDARRRTVLVADDDRDVRVLLGEYLEAKGFTVLRGENRRPGLARTQDGDGRANRPGPPGGLKGMRAWLEERWEAVGLVGAFVTAVTLSLLLLTVFGAWQRAREPRIDSVVRDAVERREILPPFDG